MNNLSLTPASRALRARETWETRDYLDFAIDGCALGPTFTNRYDFISTIGWAPLEFELEARSALMPSIERTQGIYRAFLYVCGVCGEDICCGISVQIYISNDEVHWLDFAHEWNENGKMLISHLPEIGPFTFNLHQYMGILISGSEL